MHDQISLATMRLSTMNRKLCLLPGLMLCCALAVLRPACYAQDADAPAPPVAQPPDAQPPDEAPADVMEEAPAAEPDAFGADEPATPEEALGGEEEPAAKPSASKRKGAAADAAPAPSVPDDPAVLAVLESHPETPAELLRAIDILAELDHPADAKPFVDRLKQLKLDEKAKAELVARFNAAKLMRLARHAELGPTLAPWIDDILRSADAYRRDPKRLEELASDLSSPNENIRAHAAVSLVHSGEAAVAPLIAILAAPRRRDEQPAARRVLVHLRDSAVEPLLGVLESPDPILRAEVIDVLGEIGAAQAAPQLLAPSVSQSSPLALRYAAAKALARISGKSPSYGEAVTMLERDVRQALDASRVDTDDVMAPTEVWHWNSHRNESMPIRYTATGATLATATRLARDLHLLDPANANYARLYLISLLSAAKLREGLDQPLPTGKGTAYAIAAAQGATVVDGLLADAMAGGYTAAATAAAQILGDIGSATMLGRAGAAPCPLVRALDSPDRRLSFAALGAIMKLQPSQPFAGSNKVTQALAFFASSYGSARVLVVHPRADQARKIAGLAAAAGYEGVVATNGRRAFELASRSSDYEFILIHTAVDRPPADRLLADLRRDKRTALLPVGFMATLDDLDRAQRFAERTGEVEAFLEPQNEDQMKLFTARVMARAGRSRISNTERLAQAVAALDWMSELAQSSSKVFDLQTCEPAVAEALYVPALTTRAAAVLAYLGSSRAQHSLLDLADSPTQPLELRQSAATALATSVRLHGIGLGRNEILQQYDLYNANAGRDTATHQVLTSVLNAIEQGPAGP